MKSKITKAMSAARQGFTVIEMMIASSIFAVVITISGTMIVNTINIDKSTSILGSVYDDGRLILEQLTGAIHDNAIDFEEYYSINKQISNQAYGVHYGAYGSQFINPGDGGVNPDDLGVKCSMYSTSPPPADPYDLTNCALINWTSQDENVSKNPWNSSDGDGNDAFGGTLPDRNIQEELYLISKNASEKTIFTKQLIKNHQSPDTPDYAIGYMKLTGVDTDNNGIIDIFSCKNGFECDPAINTQGGVEVKNYYDSSFPNYTSLFESPLKIFTEKKDAHSNNEYGKSNTAFVPLTSFKSTIVDLKFIINPVEDPHKAKEELNQQLQPSVTIILTMEPSYVERNKYPGGWKDNLAITIQRTVNIGVTSEIVSYPPTNDLNWIKAL